jgi:hypothetical protein
MKRPPGWSSIVFVVMGVLLCLWGLSLFWLRELQPDHWDWLTDDPEVLDYLSFAWKVAGIFTIATGVLTIVVAATAFRRGERWAWLVFLGWPLLLVALASVLPWASVLLLLLGAAAVGVLVAAFPQARSVPRSGG